MVFGTPITTINEGIIPEIMVILYPNKTIIPSEETIPINTTIKAKNIILKLRKKAYRINIVTKRARVTKMPNSFVICAVISVRINGIPDR